MKLHVVLLTLLLAGTGAFAQAPRSRDWFPQALEDLGQNATSRTEFTYDHSMLVMASKGDQEDDSLRRVIAGVDGISIHRFKFQDAGMYDSRILNAVRQEYHGSGWQHISKAHVREDNPGESDLWVRFENNTIRNVAILFAGRNQVNFFTISGSFSPLDLLHLAGHFGIPKIEGGVVIQGPNSAQAPPPPPQETAPQDNGY